MRSSFFLLALGSFLSPAVADTVTLKSGKVLKDVVVSRNDDEKVVINPWNSRNPDMTFEIPSENVLARDAVKEVVIQDPPRVTYLRAAAKMGKDAAKHFELATLAGELGLKDERNFHLERCLALDPTHAEALAAYGDAKWKMTLLKFPHYAEKVRDLEREFLAEPDPVAAKAIWTKLQAAGEKRPLAWLERARRSAQIQKGRRDQVKLTFESEKSPGATYCIYVPKNYDPLEATPLVVALHGGGPGGVDANVVEGSGEQAMPFYQDLAEQWGFLVVAPTALVAPWQKAQNGQFVPNAQYVESLLVEMKTLYNVDLTRVYVTGHSMGGFGSWFFGAKHPDWFAACAPCAGGGGPREVATNDIPVFIYHGADDPVVPPKWDRDAARTLRGDGKKKSEKDFVYTELQGVKHSFPDAIRRELFDWLAGRASFPDDRKKKFVGPQSSFDRKPSKLEIAAFGDPEQPFTAPKQNDSLTALLEDLRKGGGTGEAAVGKLVDLANKPDDKLVAKLAPLLAEEKESVDTRVLAVRAIGAHRSAAAVKALGTAIDDPDYRVVDAVITVLREIEGAESKAALARCSPKLSAWFEAARHDGDQIEHKEYSVRLASFASWLESVAAIGDAKAFFAAIERDVAQPVYLPAKPYSIPGDSDPRFKDESKKARLLLMRSLRSCLVKLGDSRGADLLERIASRFDGEPSLVSECQSGISELKP